MRRRRDGETNRVTSHHARARSDVTRLGPSYGSDSEPLPPHVSAPTAMAPRGLHRYAIGPKPVRKGRYKGFPSLKGVVQYEGCTKPSCQTDRTRWPPRISRDRAMLLPFTSGPRPLRRCALSLSLPTRRRSQIYAPSPLTISCGVPAILCPMLSTSGLRRDRCR